MRSQSKGIGSADNSASIRCNIHTIPALLRQHFSGRSAAFKESLAPKSCGTCSGAQDPLYRPEKLAPMVV